jgi:hypothetical protein
LVVTRTLTFTRVLANSITHMSTIAVQVEAVGVEKSMLQPAPLSAWQEMGAAALTF